MNTFLKTSLNTELVITILKGIVILAASSSDNIDHMEDADMYRIKQEQVIELEKIKIKDAGQYEIDEKGNQNNSEQQNTLKRTKTCTILETETDDEEDETPITTPTNEDEHIRNLQVKRSDSFFK